MRNALTLAGSRLATLSSGRLGSLLTSALFAALLWLATAAGPIPGTPVPITLQTFVVMLAALMLTWRQAAGAIAMYLTAGALGLPVFAGGGSTMSLIGPSAGFLIGFLPAAIATALLKGQPHADSLRGGMLTALRYFAATLVGCVAIDYAFGFIIQSALTHMPLGTVAAASMGFVAGDIIKATVASLAATGLTRLVR